MPKYIYYDGKIYKTTEFERIVHMKYSRLVKEFSKEHYVIFFDDFEDVIRSGDLIVIIPFGLPYRGHHYVNSVSNIKDTIKEEMKTVDNLKEDETLVVDNMYLNPKDVVEIWKRVSRTIYVRVCHKNERMELVID